MREQFNRLAIALLPIALLLDLSLGYLANFFDLPLYLNSIGTILIGVLGGPLIGALNGLISGLLASQVFGLINPLYAPIIALVGVMAGILGGRRWMQSIGRVLLAGLLTGAVAGLATGLLEAFVINQVAAVPENAIVRFALDQLGDWSLAVVSSSILIDIVDKVIAFLAVFGLLRLFPRRLVVRFPQGKEVAPPRAAPPITNAYRNRQIGPKED